MCGDCDEPLCNALAAVLLCSSALQNLALKLQVDSGRVPVSTNPLVPESESELYHYRVRNLTHRPAYPTSLRSIKFRHFSFTNVLCEAVANAVEIKGVESTVVELYEWFLYSGGGRGSATLAIANGFNESDTGTSRVRADSERRFRAL
jgi:hypothetical protein